MNQDEQHLYLLSIFHYVLAGIIAFIACFPLIHLAMGIFLIWASLNTKGPDVPPLFLGILFTIIPLAFMLLGWGLAVCSFITGRKLTKRKSWTFCMIIAAMECLFMPLGTVLGVFTIIVLVRESVKKLFTETNHGTSDTKTN